MGVNEFDFQHDPKKPITDEIASAASDFDIFQGFLNQLANPDKVLALELGGDITVYDDIGRDPRISANLGTRSRAVIGKEWNIIPASEDARDDQIAEYVKKVFLGFPFDRYRRSALRGGTLKGFSVGEIMWEVSEGDVFIKDIRYRHQRRFLFDRDGHLLLKTIGNPLGEDVTSRDGMELRKFQVVTFGEEVETPYGIGLGRELYWPWWFKKNDIKQWLMFGDKWSAPTAIGEYEPGTVPEKQRELLAAAQALHSNSAIVVPKGMMLRLLESARSGNITTYKELVDFLNNEITICILGQTGTTQGTPGKLGNDTAQENVRLDLVKADADALCEAFNARDGGMIRWLVDYQFPGHGRYPQMWIDCEEEEDKKTLAERDDKLTTAMDKSGLRLKSSYFVRVHGIQEDEIEAKPADQAGTRDPGPGEGKGKGQDVSFSEPSPGSRSTVPAHGSSCPCCGGLSFAEGEEQDPVDEIALQAMDAAEGSGITAQILRHIEASGRLERALESLPALLTELDIEAEAAAIGDAMFLAHLTGRADVLDEIAGGEVQFAEGASLPFEEAIAFFRQKLNLKSETWTDVWKGEHSRGFTVAGAMRDDMLADFREAIDRAISEGTTHAAFLDDFDAIVGRYGWSYKGNRGWRSRVIYNTNIRTAYSAGRWAQLTDPDLLQVNPYLEYRHGDSVKPRPLHVSWNGTVLPASDPWWKTHYTPNGWGCKCKVLSAGKRDLEKAGKTGPDTAPDDGTYEWVDKKTGEIHEIPRGIDPGWDYNPGEQWLNPATGKRVKL